MDRFFKIQVWISERDYDAMEKLQQKYGIHSFAGLTRFLIAREADAFRKELERKPKQ